jgi:hypothetical protein
MRRIQKAATAEATAEATAALVDSLGEEEREKFLRPKIFTKKRPVGRSGDGILGFCRGARRLYFAIIHRRPITQSARYLGITFNGGSAALTSHVN